MNRLYLLRHSRAGWALPGMRDFDRPLDEAGKADAESMGIAMRASGFVPDVTLCSNAKRARETLEGIAGCTDTGRVLFSDELYSEDAARYLEIIQKNGDYGAVLVIGHNPMMEDLALAVAGSGEESAIGTLNSGFPTTGLAVIGFEGSLSAIAPGKGYLETFLSPSDL